MEQPTTRPELPPLPDRMKSLPISPRGYPVPFFVAWIDGVPDFRVMDGAKYQRCVADDLCWLCGDKLGRYKAFVVGPMCGINRTSAEPPSHLECAEYAVKACPFLVRPKMERRDAGKPEGAASVGGISIPRNPGVTLIWVTKHWELFNAPNEKGEPGYLIEFGAPEHVLWFSEGRKATRSEVLASIESGLPALEAMCETDHHRALLADAKSKLWPLLPQSLLVAP